MNFKIGLALALILSAASPAASQQIVNPSTNTPLFTSISTPGFTSYVIPSFAQFLNIDFYGAGGGGGSGGREATSTIATGGSGASVGAFNRQRVPVALLGGAGATVPVAIGTGGIGGASIAVDSTTGVAGLPGGQTGIGTVFQYAVPDVSFTNIQTNGGSTNIYASVAFGNSVFVAVGTAGKIVTAATPSGPWTVRTSNTANLLNAVTWTGTQFVAVGGGGTIDTSPDGTTWTVQTSGTTNTLNSILWDGTTLTAVGDAGTILTSANGTAWATNAFTDNTATFTGTGSGTNLTTSVVTGTIYITQSVIGTGVPAGTYISSQTSGTPGGAGVYVTTAATTSSGAALTSSFNVRDVATDGAAHYVAVDTGGNAITATSVTGTWTAALVTLSNNYGLSSVAFGNGKWLIGGRGEFVESTSVFYNAATAGTGAWTSGFNPGYGISGIRYLNGYFIVCMRNVDQLWLSTDAASGWFNVGIGPAFLSTGPVTTPSFATYANGNWVMGYGGGLISYTPTIVNYSMIANGGVPGAGGGTGVATGSALPNGTSMFPVAAGASSSSTAGAGGGGTGICGAGAAGGSADAANVVRAPGVGGIGSSFVAWLQGGTQGQPNNLPTAGLSSTGSQILLGGAAGGGGYFGLTTAAQAGAAAGSPCAGGSGGGGSRNGFASGAGSQGGNGEIRIWAE